MDVLVVVSVINMDLRSDTVGCVIGRSNVSGREGLLMVTNYPPH